MEIKEKFGPKWTNKDIEQHVADTLAAGKVVPGYGHAVLRKTDPRFLIQLEFAEKHFGHSEWVKLVRGAYETVP